MPAKQQPADESTTRKRRCSALKTNGTRCGNSAVAGLKVCRSHGGATASSVRASKVARASQQAVKLWGMSSDTGPVDVVAELEKLARNKVTDIIALRTHLSLEVSDHIGLLVNGTSKTDYDIEGTIQSKSGYQKTITKSSGTSPWVQELHKAEMELVQILRLLQEVTGGATEVDTTRLRMQTAREAARIMKAFPGISVDDVAKEVAKRG